MAKRSIEDVDVAGQRVLMRVDFNVPLDDDATITDDRRIRLALPSIESVVRRGGRLVLMSHLGRPGGTGYEAAFSLEPAARRLGELLGDVPVSMAGQDCVGDESVNAVNAMRDGSVVVLENLRFHPGEKKGDDALAAKLASFGDVYCNEAFGTAHRSDASMVAVPRAMAGKPRVAGLLLLRELRYLSDAIDNAREPFVAVLGGAKVSDKLGAIRHLAGRVNAIIVGGAMAYTFLKAGGLNVGDSRVEHEMIDEASGIMRRLEQTNTALHLPTDHVCAAELREGVATQVHGPGINDGLMGLDIGPESRTAFAQVLAGAATMVWNGPMGVFETPPFDAGTRAVAEAMVKATSGGAISVVGGGDTAAAVEAFGLAGQFSHVSTGGGASLQMLEGQPFESVELLDDA